MLPAAWELGVGAGGGSSWSLKWGEGGGECWVWRDGWVSCLVHRLGGAGCRVTGGTLLSLPASQKWHLGFGLFVSSCSWFAPTVHECSYF